MTLNSLQSNASTLEEIKKHKERQQVISNNNIILTQLYLERAGISLKDLDDLPIIHVAGQFSVYIS